MILKPQDREDLSAMIAAAKTSGTRIETFDLSSLANIVHHTPEDMTVAVEAGMTLSALQTRLRERGQWLPVDPPNPDRLTIGGLLAMAPSGPRRFGHGTVREHLIGIEVALADGRAIKAGGQVVKNVAGYDLCKLFVGSRGALGCIVEATFKLRPLPDEERFVKRLTPDHAAADRLIANVLESPITPIAIELHGKQSRTPELVLGFAGSKPEVDWQIERAGELGFNEPADLAHEVDFWRTPRGKIHTVSTLPSSLSETLDRLSPEVFVARAGNGQIHYLGRPPSGASTIPAALTRRTKQMFDPDEVFPSPSWTAQLQS